MRKFFGAKVIQANKSDSSNPSGPSSRRHAALQRSNLTRPKATWWSSSQREGLSIRPLSTEELESKQTRYQWGAIEEKWWTVEYSQRYKSMTKSFIGAVMSGREWRYQVTEGLHNGSPFLDPEALWDVLKKLPWHADNLLQLAEIYRHREGLYELRPVWSN